MEMKKSFLNQEIGRNRKLKELSFSVKTWTFHLIRRPFATSPRLLPRFRHMVAEFI
jgi:hypothetical protein